MIDLVGRSVAVVGAGISGLKCAQHLHEAGCAVQVLDKSGDIGGRLTVRVRPEGNWNHGAQQVAGPRDMRELLRPLAESLDCEFDCAVSKVTRVSGGWRLLDQKGGLHGDYAALVLALPAPQASRLLSGISETGLVRQLERQVGALIEPLEEVVYDSCWALLVRGASARKIPDVSGNDVISAIHVQADSQCWVVHATSAWSAQNLEQDKTAAAQSLLMELKALCSADRNFKVEHAEAHRWRYSTVNAPALVPALWDSNIQLGLCGDWCQPVVKPGSNSDSIPEQASAAESAFLSGLALAQKMLN